MTTPPTLAWWRDGEALLAATVAALPDDDLDGASLLPGWSRRTLLAHVAGNAEALGHLVTWATTGVETPMYASPQARTDGIAARTALPTAALREEVATSAAALAAAIEAVSAAAWDHRVRTAQGREVPAAQIPWMRCKEVWVHTVDLAAGVDFADLPADVVRALADDVVATWAGRGELAAAVATLTGRSEAALPRWI